MTDKTISTDNSRHILNAFSGLLLACVTIASSFLQYKFFYNFLVSDSIGFWLLLLSIGAFVNLLDLGLSPTLGREIAFRWNSSIIDERGISILLACSQIYYIFIGLFTLIISLLSLHFLPNVEGTWLITYILFFIGVVIQMITAPSYAILIGTGHIFLERVIRILGLILNLLLTFILLSSEFGVFGVAAAWAASNLVTFLVCKIAALSRLGQISTIRLYELKKVDLFSSAKIVIGPSLRWSLTTVGAVLIFKSDALIISSLIDLASVASYEAHLRVILAIQSIAFLIASSSTTAYSTMFAEGRVDDIRKLMLANLRYTCVIVAVPAVFLLFFMEQVIIFWLGPDVFLGRLIAGVLLLFLLFEVHHVVFATAVMATGKIIFHKAAIIGGLLNIVISSALTIKLGLFGVAIGSLLAQLLTSNWYVPYKSIKILNIPFLNYRQEIGPIFRLYLFLVTLGLIYSVYGRAFLDQMHIFGLLFIYCTISLIYIYIKMLKESERKIIWNSLKRIILK